MKYNVYEVMKYLIFIYIIHATKFVKCFINRVLHFNTTITFRKKNDHAVLKKKLKSFIENFKTIINNVVLLLINEYENYRLNLNETKNRYFLNFNQFCKFTPTQST